MRSKQNLFWENQVETIKLSKSAVELVRNAREKLSEQEIDLNEINKL